MQNIRLDLSNIYTSKFSSLGISIGINKGNFMKALVILFSLLLSYGAMAEVDCYGSVLNDYSLDSNSFQIYDEQISEAFENKDSLASSMAVRSLEQQLDCRSGAFEISDISCKEIIPGNSTSKVCYLESQYGFFFVSVDMMEKVNIVFSRWD